MPRAKRSSKAAAQRGVEKARSAATDDAVWSTDEVKPFWETKRLNQMTPDEWDLLCDGCGQCCLNKIEEEDTGRIYLTRLSCSPARYRQLPLQGLHEPVPAHAGLPVDRHEGREETQVAA